MGCDTNPKPDTNRILAQDLDEPCAGKSGADLFGFYGVDTDKIYRRIGGFRVVVMQKHAKRGRNAILKRFEGRLGRWSVAGLRSCTMRGPRPLVLKRSSSSWPLWPRLRRSRHAPRGRWRTISAVIAEKEAGAWFGTSSGNS